MSILLFTSPLQPCRISHKHPEHSCSFFPLGLCPSCSLCLECPYALSKSSLSGRFFPLQEAAETSHLGSLAPVMQCFTVSYSQINFWHLLYCEIYVSVSPFDSRTQRAKICSCSSLDLSTLHRQTVNFQSLFYIELKCPC